LRKKKKKKKNGLGRHENVEEKKQYEVLQEDINPKKRIFRYLPFIILLVLALIYFAPFLSGKKMMYGSDWLLGGYSKRVWSTQYILENKEIPMWFPHIFGGCPTVAAFFGDIFSPHTLLFLIFPVHTVWAYLFVTYIFLAGVGIYLFLKEMKLGFYPALFGGLAYMFSGSLISTTYAGHLGRLISVALLPLMLLFINKGVKRQKLHFFVFFSGITALSFLAGHFQMTYYATGIAIFYLIFLVFGERKILKTRGIIKIASFFIVCIVVLTMLVSISFLPVLRNLSFGARGITKGYEYTTSWSMPTAELIDFVIPDFSGTLNHYWGENYFKLNNEYMGILPIILLIIGVFFCFKDRRVKFFFFTGLAAMFLALGKNTAVFKIAYYIIPGIKKFRAPSLIFFVMVLCVTVIAAFGMKRVLERKDNKRILMTILVFMACLLVFTFVAAVGKEGIVSFLKTHFSYMQLSQGSNKLKAFTENYSFFVRGLGKALLFSILSFILILSFVKDKLKAVYVIPVLLLILIIDQWSVEKRFLESSPNPREYYEKDGVISFFEKDESIFRIFPFQYGRSNDGILFMNGIQSLGGYHPNPLRRYQELTGAGESVMFNPENLLRHTRLLDILNCKYVVGVPLPDDTMRFDERSRMQIRQLREYYSKFNRVHQGQYAIYENPKDLTRAFFVEDYRVFDNKDDLLKFMETDEFQPERKVLLERKPDIIHPDTIIGGSEVVIKKYNANTIELDVDAKTEGFLVLSENYYPRFNAYVDGIKRRVYIANYTLRAVAIEKGKHVVVFAYEDSSYTAGKIFSIIGFVILLLSFVFQFIGKRKNLVASDSNM